MPSTSIRTCQVPHDEHDRRTNLSSRGPPLVHLEPYTEPHGDLYSDEEDLYGGEDDEHVEEHEAGSVGEESEVECALFTKSERLHGPKIQALEKKTCNRLSPSISTTTTRSVPMTPVNEPEVASLHRPAGMAQRTAGTPRLSEGVRGGDKEDEFDRPSVAACKAQRGRVKPPASPMQAPPAREGTVLRKTHVSTGHAERAKLRLQVIVGDESDDSPAAGSSPGTFPWSRDGKHSLLTPDLSSSSSTTPISTPRSGRRRSVDLSHPDRSLACEILFGGEEAELRTHVATARGNCLRKKMTERHRGREHRMHVKSPLMAECSKGSRSLGHGNAEGEGSSKEKTPRHSRSRSGNCDFASLSKTLNCNIAKHTVHMVAPGEVQGLSIVDGQVFEEDTECRIDDFDPVGNYLPFLGVGDAVYDKISGCKSSMK